MVLKWHWVPNCCGKHKWLVLKGLNSYHRVPFHDQAWTPMRENIFWKKSLLIAGLTCPQTNLRQKTVMMSISQPYHIYWKSRISGLDGRTASAPNYKRKRPPVQFTEHTSCTQDCSKFSPVQIFQLYICQAVWELMVEETNRYAAQTLSAHTANQPSAWTPTNVPEMMAFVALLLSMGINKRPRYSMHWSTSEVLRVPCSRRPWLTIDSRQSFDFCTSPTTKLKTNSPLTNFSKFPLYWTLYCHPFFGSISLEETSHRTRLW